MSRWNNLISFRLIFHFPSLEMFWSYSAQTLCQINQKIQFRTYLSTLYLKIQVKTILNVTRQLASHMVSSKKFSHKSFQVKSSSGICSGFLPYKLSWTLFENFVTNNLFGGKFNFLATSGLGMLFMLEVWKILAI